MPASASATASKPLQELADFVRFVAGQLLSHRIGGLRRDFASSTRRCRSTGVLSHLSFICRAPSMRQNELRRSRARRTRSAWSGADATRSRDRSGIMIVSRGWHRRRQQRRDFSRNLNFWCFCPGPLVLPVNDALSDRTSAETAIRFNRLARSCVRKSCLSQMSQNVSRYSLGRAAGTSRLTPMMISPAASTPVVCVQPVAGPRGGCTDKILSL